MGHISLEKYLSVRYSVRRCSAVLAGLALLLSCCTAEVSEVVCAIFQDLSLRIIRSLLYPTGKHCAYSPWAPIRRL